MPSTELELYGNEGWVCQNDRVSKINAIEILALRKICDVMLANRIRNEEKHE